MEGKLLSGDDLELIHPAVSPNGRAEYIEDGDVPYSPDAFKENIQPEKPLSGGKAKSPGRSPLGLRRAGRTPHRNDSIALAGKLPKRTLKFGESQIKLGDALDKMNLEAQSQRTAASLSQDCQSCASMRKSSPVSSGVEQHASGWANSDSVGKRELLLNAQGPFTLVADTSHLDAARTAWTVEPPSFSLPDVSRNDNMLEYDFTEDGEPVDPAFTRIDRNSQEHGGISGDTDLMEDSGRAVLGELEGVVMDSPPSRQKGSKKWRKSEFGSPSRKGTKDFSMSQPGTPIRSPLRM